jgi:hypothetical protein
MALSEDDKKEVEGIVSSSVTGAVTKVKEELEKLWKGNKDGDQGGQGGKQVVPAPAKPKNNQQMTEPEKKEESMLSKMWKAIW